MWFEALSGLKMNLSKIEIFPIGGRENIEVLTAELGCKDGSLPDLGRSRHKGLICPTLPKS